VDEMYRLTEGKFDLYNNGTAREVVNSLSLLNLIIVDEANARVWWYEEADGEYDLKSVEVIRKEDRQISQGDLLKTVLSITK